MSHTPGPWTLYTYNWSDKGRDGDWAGYISGPNGERVYGGAASFHAINKLDNARLIARAPDLLAACELWLSRIERGSHSTIERARVEDQDAEMLRPLIAAAKGESCQSSTD